MSLANFLGTAVVDTITLFYKFGTAPWIGVVNLDASLSEAHVESGTATEHPVEDGSDIADHYRVNPRSLQMTGFLTNTPLRKPLSQAEGVREVDKEFTWTAPFTISSNDTPLGVGVDVPSSGLLGGGIQGIAAAVGANQHSGTARGFTPEFDRVGAAFDELSKLVQDGVPVAVYTSIRMYENMVLENLQTTEVVTDRSTGEINSITFTADLKQIRTVATALTDAPAPAPAVTRAQKNKNQGKKAGEELVSGDALQSLASSALETTGSLF